LVVGEKAEFPNHIYPTQEIGCFEIFPDVRKGRITLEDKATSVKVIHTLLKLTSSICSSLFAGKVNARPLIYFTQYWWYETRLLL